MLLADFSSAELSFLLSCRLSAGSLCQQFPSPCITLPLLSLNQQTVCQISLSFESLCFPLLVYLFYSSSLSLRAHVFHFGLPGSANLISVLRSITFLTSTKSLLLRNLTYLQVLGIRMWTLFRAITPPQLLKGHYTCHGPKCPTVDDWTMEYHVISKTMGIRQLTLKCMKHRTD